MPNYKNLANLVEYQAKHSDHGLIFIKGTDDEERLAYSELYSLACRHLSRLHSLGIRRGHEAIFQFESNKDFLVAFWACVIGGIIPVPLSIGYTEENLRKISRVINLLTNPAVLGNTSCINDLERHLATLSEYSIPERVQKRFFVFEVDMAPEDRAEPTSIAADDIAFIQFSSGSTGEPKGVVLTHANLMTNLNAITSGIQAKSHEKCLSWMPLTHDMGLIGFHLSPMFAGMNQYHMPTNLFIRRPTLWLNKASEHKIEVLSSPNFGYRFLLSHAKPGDIENWDLKGVRVIFNGAEPINHETCQEFLTKLAPCGISDSCIFPVYGLAEACLAVTFSTPGVPVKCLYAKRDSLKFGHPVITGAYDDPECTAFVDLGLPVADCEVEIGSDDFQPIPEGRIGNILIRGRNVTSGYFRNAEATASAISHDGWLNTGDLGFLYEGRLFVTGRAKDIIFVNGANVYSHDLERVIQQYETTRLVDVAVCGYREEGSESDSIVAFYHYKKDAESFRSIANEIMKHLFSKTGHRLTSIIPVSRMPKTTSGKIQRFKLLEMYLAGELQGIKPNDSDRIGHENQAGKAEEHLPTEAREKLLVIFSGLFPGENLSAEGDFFDMGLDSMTIFQAIAVIKQQTGIELTFEDFLKYGSIAELAIHLDAKIREGTAKEPETALDKTNGEVFPLTHVQRAYLLGRDRLFEMGNVSSHYYAEIEVDLDPALLEKSLNAVIQRHPMLRAVATKDGRQLVLESVPHYELARQDFSACSSDEQTARLQLIRDHMSHQCFDVHKWPSFEFRIAQTNDDKAILFTSVDLIFADGPSLQIVLNDIVEHFNTGTFRNGSPEITFENYINSVSQHELEEKSHADREFWMSKLAGFAPAAALPTKTSPSTIKDPRFTRVECTIPQNEWYLIKSICSRESVSPSVFLATIYGEVLSYWSNQPKHTINLTVFNRQPIHSDVFRVVGDFTSLLLLSFDAQEGRSHWEKARQLQARLYEGLGHKGFDGVEVIREFHAANNLPFATATMPIVFTSMLSAGKLQSENGLGGLGKRRFELSQTPQVFLDCQVSDFNDDLYVSWDFVDELFDRELVQSAFGMFKKAILSFAATGKVECTLSLDSQNLISAYNCTEIPREPMTLVQLLQEAAGKHMERTALSHGNREMTYRELEQRSNQVGHFLLSKGISVGDRVCVIAERSIETIVALVGILKVGAAYVPIEPSNPTERIEYIERNCESFFRIEPGYFESCCIDGYTNEAMADRSIADATAYIIYTSGSTGTPKGVVITHHAVVNTILDINEKYSLTDSDVVLGISSLCFDLSVYDVFGTLSVGAELAILSDNKNMKLVKSTLRDRGVTFWNSVPAIMGMLIDSLDIDCSDDASIRPLGEVHEGLRVVMLSGDWIPLALPPRVNTYFGNAKLYSLGGATEVSIWSIHYPIEKIEQNWRSIPYGYPLANQTFHVLNFRGEDCPIGVPGELYIGGVGLASEYLKDAEKTALAFVQHAKYGRLYRTGDFGLMSPSGYIEFLGRRDHQVKIRGYRVELGEIETHLGRYPGLTQAVVIDRQGARGSKYLCCYFVSPSPVDTNDLAVFLSDRLPEYMIPTAWVKLDSIPVTQNGKVDRRQLPEPALDAVMGSDNGPLTATEEGVMNLFCKVLGVDHVPVGANFFDLGGDSLAATGLIGNLEKHFGVEVALSAVFANPTVRSLASLVEKEATTRPQVQTKDPNLILLKKGTGSRNLFFIHAGSGEIEVYVDFCNSLKPEFTCWAIRADRYENHGPLNLSVEYLGSKYLKMILDIQEVDPYYLAGWCLGGTIAFEMARQLEDMGETVAFVGLINSEAPEKGLLEYEGDFHCGTERALLSSTFGPQLVPESVLALDNTHAMWQTVIATCKDLGVTPEQVKAFVPTALVRLVPNYQNLDTERLIFYANLFRTFQMTRALYSPGNSISSAVHLFEASDEPVANKNRWLRFTKHPITEWIFRGDHVTILRQPSVFENADVFNTALEMVESKDPACV